MDDYGEAKHGCDLVSLGIGTDSIAVMQDRTTPVLSLQRRPKQRTVQKSRMALDAAGVRFIDADDQDGPGVRLSGTKAKRGEKR